MTSSAAQTAPQPIWLTLVIAGVGALAGAVWAQRATKEREFAVDEKRAIRDREEKGRDSRSD